MDNDIVLFGEANFRNKDIIFGIKMDDRRRHMYIIGKTGMGKSELLKNIAIQDIQAGRGLAFVDPHGDPVKDLLDYIPQERIDDVIYVNPSDMEHPVAFNVMESVDPDKRHLVADGIMAVFKKLWIDLWSARMEYILNYTILALLEVPETTLLGINRMLAEKDYRKWVVEQITDPEVKAFWTQEFAKWEPRYVMEATAAIQNKIGQFVSNVLIRNIVGQSKSSFDVRKAMDEQKILLIDISKGKVGEDASRLLGGLLVTKIQIAAMSRADIPMSERKDFVLIVDEFQNFATASFANILSEARKFNLSLVVAHQYVAQMDEAVADAVFGNVGTIVAFRVGAEDAELLEKEFSPEFLATDIVNLGKREIYLKLSIDGVASKAFSARTMDTIAIPAISLKDEVIEVSRKTYARPRKDVEEAILKWRVPISGVPVSSSYEERPSKPKNQYYRPNNESRNDYQSPPPRYNDAPRPPRDNYQSRPQNDYSPRLPWDNYPSTRTGSPSGKTTLSLDEAMKREPVDFKGRTIKSHPSEPKSKPKIDLEGLHQAIDKSLAKNKGE